MNVYEFDNVFSARRCIDIINLLCLCKEIKLNKRDIESPNRHIIRIKNKYIKKMICKSLY